MSVVGKVYGRVLIGRVKELTDGMIGEEQRGFRDCSGCVDQAFVVKEREKEMFGCFLEKAYDRVRRSDLWRILEKFGVLGRLGRGIKALYDNCMMYVRVGREESEKFRVGSELRQGCVMSPWLFSMVMESVCRRMAREDKG